MYWEQEWGGSGPQELTEKKKMTKVRGVGAFFGVKLSELAILTKITKIPRAEIESVTWWS